MDFKKGFTPGWLNIGGATIITLLWWFFVRHMTIIVCDSLKFGETLICSSAPPFKILLKNYCGCYTWSNFFGEAFVAILLPFIVVYVVLSRIKAKD